MYKCLILETRHRTMLVPYTDMVVIICFSLTGITEYADTI